MHSFARRRAANRVYSLSGNMRRSARRFLVSTSLVTVMCLGGQTAFAQTTSLNSSNDSSPAPFSTAQPPALGGFFRNTLNDFTNLTTSKETIAWLALGAFAATSAGPVDPAVTLRVSSSPVGPDLRAGNIVGGKEFQFGASIAAYGIGRLTGNQRVSQVAGSVFRAQLMAQAVTGAIKFTAQRTRPDGSDQRSFPSGHTSVSFASATVLQRELGWKVGLPAYAAATYVAAARIEKKKHYLSDVAMGAAIGILSGRTVTIGRGDKRFALAPAATSDGASINFTWVGSGH
jgi:membrane-associated phospholipid phosphatase